MSISAPQPSGDAAGGAFTIISQDHRDDYDAQGRDRSRWRITFSTPSGTTAYVDVLDSDYNVENVARIVAEKVQTIEAVHQLGQPDG